MKNKYLYSDIPEQMKGKTLIIGTLGNWLGGITTHCIVRLEEL